MDSSIKQLWNVRQPESQSSQQKITWQDTKLFCFFRLPLDYAKVGASSVGNELPTLRFSGCLWMGQPEM